MKKLISIVMPSYNSALTIKESIDSVLSQTYKNWELLITDDCSSDDTLAILHGYSQSDSRIRIFQNEENSGAGVSRNKSIEMASGVYIAFLDSDDIWMPEKLEKQVEFMDKNGYALTYTSYQKFDKNGPGKIISPPLTVNYSELLYSNVIGCLTAMYDVDKLGKQYMPLIRKRQDMGLWLKILKTCNQAYCLPEVLALYRSDTGMTQNKINASIYQWRFYREVVQLGVLSSLWYFSWYIVKGLIKHKG